MTEAPFLLLHGVCSTGATLGALAEALRARGLDVTAPTLAAQRRTDVGVIDGSAARLTLDMLLDEARGHARFLRERHRRKHVIVGHSNGALRALALAEEASALGLVAPAPPPSVAVVPAWVRQAMFSRIFGSGWTTRTIHFRPSWPFQAEAPPAAVSATLCPDSGPAVAEAMEPERAGPFDPAPSLPCPTVIIACERDSLVPLGLTRSLAGRFEARHVVIPKARHWAVGDPNSADTICEVLLSLAASQEVQP